ncbi:MAG TPA: hypothetical protein VMU10_11090 [Desulfomonilia bacterium]|nr:hypothetical protein [Desulfomonilia bacterium]
MAISYQILKDKRMVIVTTSKETNLNEAIQSLEQMFADPEYSEEYDLLWDDTERTTVFTYDDIEKIAQHFKHYRGYKHPKRAFVVSQAVKHGMTRVYNAMTSVSSQAQIGLFHDRKEALKWLEH